MNINFPSCSYNYRYLNIFIFKSLLICIFDDKHFQYTVFTRLCPVDYISKTYLKIVVCV